jgi:hypothetical protein
MTPLARTARRKTLASWVAFQAGVGVIWVALAWWLTDLLYTWSRPLPVIGVGGGARGVLAVLGFTGIGLISFAVVIWSRAAGVTGGVVLIAALILGGFGSGTGLVDGELGFLFTGAHNPIIYVLLGTWIGGLIWNLRSALRTGVCGEDLVAGRRNVEGEGQRC